MTVTVNDRTAGPFVCTGGETVFSYDFRLLDAGDLAVYRLRGGAQTRLALNTDYAVTGVGAAGGGNVVLVAAAVADDQYVLDGDRPKARITDLVYNRALPPQTLNPELDSLQIQIAELARQANRALYRSRFDDPSEAPLELPPLEPGKHVGVDDAGNLDYFAADGGGGNIPDPLPIGDGGTGATTEEGARTNLGLGGLAVLNAVGADQITDGSVGTAKLANDAVTRAKLAPEIAGHPLGRGSAMQLRADADTHFWSGPPIYDEARGRLYFVSVRTRNHGMTYGAQLCLDISEDGGHSLSQERVIITLQDSEPRFPVGCLMSNGRIGVFYSLILEAGSQTQRFSYSDDQGETWTHLTLTVDHLLNAHGQMLPWPASAGGSDTGGYIVYGYGGSPPSIICAKTTNYGAIWTTSVAVAAGPSDYLVEPAVVKLDATHWAMVIRNGNSDASTAYNCYGSVSTNMTTWSAKVDAGLQLGAQAPAALLADGYMWIYTCMREGYGAPIGIENELVYHRVLPATWIANSGALGPQTWTRAGALPGRATGYIYFTSNAAATRFWAILTAGEDVLTAGDAISSSDLILLAPERMVQPSPHAGVVRPNMIRNGDFQSWGGGTAFANHAGGAICDFWEWDGSGAVAQIQRAVVEDELRRMLPFHSYYCLSIDTSADPDNFSGIKTTETGPEALARFADRVLTWTIWGSGTVPTDCVVQVLLDYGSGGSAATNTTVAIDPRPSGGSNAAWFSTVTMATPTLVGKTVGTGSKVELSIKGGAATSPWQGRLYACKIEAGNTATAIDNGATAVVPTAAQVSVTPVGNIEATTVQAALQELDTEKASIAAPVFTTSAQAPLFKSGSDQVVGARNTGWTAMTGTGSKAALAAAAAGTASGTYQQSELQAALNRIAAMEARMQSLDAALITHGLIGP